MFAQAASGLAHLHTRRICHRDLHCKNILVDDVAQRRDGAADGCRIVKVVLCDLGQALRYTDAGADGSRSRARTMTCATAPLAYRAPELFFAPETAWHYSGNRWKAVLARQTRARGEPCDVWSLGICGISAVAAHPFALASSPFAICELAVGWLGEVSTCRAAGYSLPEPAPSARVADELRGWKERFPWLAIALTWSPQTRCSAADLQSACKTAAGETGEVSSAKRRRFAKLQASASGGV